MARQMARCCPRPIGRPPPRPASGRSPRRSDDAPASNLGRPPPRSVRGIFFAEVRREVLSCPAAATVRGRHPPRPAGGPSRRLTSTYGLLEVDLRSCPAAVLQGCPAVFLHGCLAVVLNGCPAAELSGCPAAAVVCS